MNNTIQTVTEAKDLANSLARSVREAHLTSDPFWDDFVRSLFLGLCEHVAKTLDQPVEQEAFIEKVKELLRELMKDEEACFTKLEKEEEFRYFSIAPLKTRNMGYTLLYQHLS